MSCGKMFHKVAAVTAKKLSFNKLLLAERNAPIGLYGHTRLDKYFGALQSCAFCAVEIR